MTYPSSGGQQMADDKGILRSANDWLAGLPVGMLLFLMFGGTILMGALDTTFGFIVFLFLLALLLSAGAKLASSFGSGVRYTLLWLIIGFILFFNLGRLIDQSDYWAFGFHMALVIGILTVVCLNRFQMTIWRALATITVGTLVYLAAGVPIGFWKWHNYNQTQFEHLLDRQASWLVSLKTELNNQREAEKPAADIPRSGQDGYTVYPAREAVKPPFTPVEMDAIDALVVTDTTTLRQASAIPTVLKDRWLKHVDHYGLKLPTLLESKATFFGWVSAWPGVLLYLVFDDLIERVVDWIYAKVEYYLTYIQLQIVGDRLEFIQK